MKLHEFIFVADFGGFGRILADLKNPLQSAKIRPNPQQKNCVRQIFDLIFILKSAIFCI
jgi:hypothetical protein